MKSGNLNFLEPSGPLKARNGTDLPLFLIQNPIDARPVQTLNFLSFMDFDNRQRRLAFSAQGRGRLEEASSLLFCRHHEPLSGYKAVEK